MGDAGDFVCYNNKKYKLIHDKYACNGLFMLGEPPMLLLGDNIYKFKYFNTGGGQFDPVFYTGVNCEDRWLTVEEIRSATRLSVMAE